MFSLDFQRLNSTVDADALLAHNIYTVRCGRGVLKMRNRPVVTFVYGACLTVIGMTLLCVPQNEFAHFVVDATCTLLLLYYVTQAVNQKTNRKLNLCGIHIAVSAVYLDLVKFIPHPQLEQAATQIFGLYMIAAVVVLFPTSEDFGHIVAQDCKP